MATLNNNAISLRPCYADRAKQAAENQKCFFHCKILRVNSMLLTILCAIDWPEFFHHIGA